MAVRQPAPGDLAPIETANRDEIQALQLQRLRWTLQHAYDNVPHYQRAFDARACTPVICSSCPIFPNSRSR